MEHRSLLHYSRYLALCVAMGTPLSACGGGERSAGLAPLPGAPASRQVAAGLYVADFEQPAVFGYASNNQKNDPPICRLLTKYSNGVAVDGHGNLIVPATFNYTISVFAGPAMCGPLLGAVRDPYGLPSDAASNDAANGKIVVANFDGLSGSGDGNVAICTLAAGCTTRLASPHLDVVAGVAIAPNGNCWASASDSAGKPTLLYFKGCSGAGTVASGFRNSGYGGLDIDNGGNLVSIGFGSLYVYKGCDPKCSLVGGPFALRGAVLYGHLNEKNTAFAVGNASDATVDVYKYGRRSLTFWYSFDNGFGPSDDVEGAAYNPRSKE